MKKRNPISEAVRYALSAGVAASLVAPQVVMAQEEEDVADQGLITVTGSRIKRVDIEGPSPVVTISREDIDTTGDITVADVLRATPYNTFGSFTPRSGTGNANGNAAVSLRGLGSNRTLVLLDGRRMSGGALAGASTQNLNVIPFAAVERIEILNDGASAVYGSDAVGGVVNVILRKDYEGVKLYGQVGRPTQEGGDEDSYGIVGGISSGKGNITFALDHAERQHLTSADRAFTRTGLSPFGFPGTMFVTTTDQFGNFIDLGGLADPRCPTGGLGSSAEFPNSFVRGNSFTSGTECAFNFAGAGGDSEAGIDRNSIFVQGNYNIDENTQIFARGIFGKQDNFGRYAPAPIAGPILSMSANNPNNPTNPAAFGGQFSVLPGPVFNANGDQLGVGNCIFSPSDPDQDPDPGCDTALMQNYTGPFPLPTIAYRNVPGGARNSLGTTSFEDYLLGFRGFVDWFGGADWEIGAQYSEQRNDNIQQGLAFANILQNRVDDGSFDIFGVNGPTSPTVAASAGHEGFTNRLHRVSSVDGTLIFNVGELPGGPLGLAVGTEYRDEKFDDNQDAAQNAFIVAGSAGGADVTGARAVFALFTEANIPVLPNLEVSLAGRYDKYNDFGTTTNPKLSVGFRPIDSLLLRASYGMGFRAPSMTELYSSASLSNNGAVDTTRCNNTGQQNVDPSTLPSGHPCLTVQFTNVRGGNTNLDAETSDSLTVGAVWSPLDDLTFSINYFDIQVDDEIRFLPIQSSLNLEFQQNMGGLQGTSLVSRNVNGSVNTIAANFQNIAATRTDGFDVEVAYGFSPGQVGDFDLRLLATSVSTFERDLGDGNGFNRLAGTFDPDFRANGSLTWSRGDWSANIQGNHITDTTNGAAVFLDSYTTWDLQVDWATPWNGRITVGARNIFDEDPPTATNFQNIYSNQLHDIFGRVPYIRYEQDL